MNWTNPASVMRAKIVGVEPRCHICHHGTTDWREELRQWCAKRESDPNPGEPADQPEQVCEEFWWKGDPHP